MGVPLIPDRAAARSFERGDTTPAAPRDRRVTGAAALAVSILVGATIAGIAPLPAAATLALLVPAAVIDVEERRLPDAWVGAAVSGLVMTLLATSVTGTDVDPAGAIGGALVMALPLLAVHLTSPEAMGFGDVKAGAVLGAALGTVDWRLAAVALCLAALLGTLAGLVGRRRSIAFGPPLVAAAIAVLIANEPIVESMFGGTS